MTKFTRTFDAARANQGFRSQAHLAAFFAALDHTESCADCRALDGYVELDDGMQPTSGRCDVARRLEAEESAAGREPVALARIPNGTLVRLDDGTIATGYLDRDGTYRTSQINPVTRGTRIDLGWRREQLTVVAPGQTGGAS